jgi:hypothetical protein
MKTIYRLFAIACVAVAGVAGCTADSALGIENTDPGPAPQTSVVRYSGEDITALVPGDFLRLDLTVPDTVYVLTYTDPANLERVLVVHGDDEYILANRAPATAKVQSDALKQIVVSGDLAVDSQSGDSVVQPAGTTVTCRCPCCIELRGWLFCCSAP